jgi:hypothetical protein
MNVHSKKPGLWQDLEAGIFQTRLITSHLHWQYNLSVRIQAQKQITLGMPRSETK